MAGSGAGAGAGAETGAGSEGAKKGPKGNLPTNGLTIFSGYIALLSKTFWISNRS